MASYTPILPPPQSLDDLDAWGSIDSLPWSLDSGVWLVAGVYRITAEETASSQGNLSKWTRIRVSELLQNTASSGEAEGNIIRELVITGTACMDGEQIGGVARAIPVAPIHARSGETFEPYRLRTAVIVSDAQTGNEAAVYRVRTDKPSVISAAGEYVYLSRVLVLLAFDAVQSRETVYPEYKGWTWKNLANKENSQWSAIETQTQNWRRITVKNTCWRGVVQWQ